MRKRTMLALTASTAAVGTAFAVPALGSDSTLALLREGYAFIPNRRRRYGSDTFETRLMLKKTICVTGAEAARAFYEPERFTRKGAMPPTTVRLLQDLGSVQVLDGEAHRHRKSMFMALMGPESIARLADRMADEWRAFLEKWETLDGVVLHDETEEILCRAACAWAGVPLSEPDAGRRTREISAMIDGAGAIGPRLWRGLLLRARTERWLRGVVEEVRGGELEVPEGSPIHVIAWHRDLDGELLDTRVAAVEVLNLLRPIVAIARFVTFSALALHEHPECSRKIRTSGDDYLELFVHEVRRLYPFFPFIGGRVRNEFDWRGRHLAEGTWVILDLYGTNRDPRTWKGPDEFRPERFRGWDEGAFDFVPQGGGDYGAGHRCAGEWITIEVMKRAARLLTTAMTYDVPEQDLRIDLSRMPTRPESRFVISSVRRTRQTGCRRKPENPSRPKSTELLSVRSGGKPCQ
jgi:fatty-acid peroxygenase